MKIAIVSSNDKHRSEIVRLLRARNPLDSVEILSLDKLANIAESALPEILLLDQPSVHDGDLDRLERLGHLYPRLAFILLCEEHSPDLLIQAMRAGVREVLPSPVDPNLLFPAIVRVEQKLDSRIQSHGKVLAFISCKGGSGATFIAANLGYAIASLQKKRVALIDLNLQFGDASLLLSDQKPLATLADVAQQIHRLDSSFLASSMLSVGPNYFVLASPEDPTHANDVKPEHVDAILKLARRHYDFILLDIGRGLDEVSIGALDQADTVFPILQTTLSHVRDGKRLLTLFRSLDYRKDKIELIVNRYQKSGDISLHDLETAYAKKVFRTIPNQYHAAAASINQGVPILKLARSSALAKSFQDFAAALAGRPAEAAPGWFARVLQRA